MSEVMETLLVILAISVPVGILGGLVNGYLMRRSYRKEREQIRKEREARRERARRPCVLREPDPGSRLQLCEEHYGITFSGGRCSRAGTTYTY